MNAVSSVIRRFAVATLAAITFVVGGAVLPVAAQGGSPSTLSACAGDASQLDVLLVISESVTLQVSDPNADRIVAGRVLLADLAGVSASGTPVAVAMGAMGNGYATALPFTDLTAETLPAVEAELAAFATRNTAVDNDYVAAATGALAEFSARPAATGTCSVMVLVTDTGFEIAERTADNVGALGQFKPYAPETALDEPGNASAATRAGVEAACGAGGLADQLRTADVAVATLALTANMSLDATTFAEAFSTGSTDGGQCGQESSIGSFSGAADTASMIEAADELGATLSGSIVTTTTANVCQVFDCPAGAQIISIGEAVENFSVFGSFDRNNYVLAVTGPDGDKIAVAETTNTVQEVAGATIASTWTSPSTVSIVVTPGTAPIEGDWTFSVIDPEERGDDSTTATLRRTTALDAMLEIGEIGDAAAGATFEVAAQVVNSAGEVIDPTSVNELTARATLTDSEGLSVTADLVPGADDQLVGTLDLPEDFAPAANLEVALLTTTGTNFSLANSPVEVGALAPPAPVVVEDNTPEPINTEQPAADDGGPLFGLGLFKIIGIVALAAIAAALFLLLKTRRGARFDTSISRVGVFRVIIRANGRVDRQDGPDLVQKLYFKGNEFADVPGKTKRSFNHGEYRVAVNQGLNPLDDATGFVHHKEHVVIGNQGASESMGSNAGEIGLDLIGAWAFAVDYPTTEAANDRPDLDTYGDIHGELVLFIGHSLQASRSVLANLPKELAPAARQAYRHARSKHDAGDGSDAKMLDWVDNYATVGGSSAGVEAADEMLAITASDEAMFGRPDSELPPATTPDFDE